VRLSRFGKNSYLYGPNRYPDLNTIDLIVVLTLVLAVWNGWRQGFIVQVCSLAGIVAGIWLAARFGPAVGGWLRLDESVASAGGFAVVLVAAAVAVAVGARVLRRIFRFAGFGLFDIVLGIAVAALKYLLVLSVLFAAFDSLNADYALVERRIVAESRCYEPVMHLSGRVLPFIERVRERISAGDLVGDGDPDPQQLREV